MKTNDEISNNKAINAKIDKNRDLINDIVLSDADPSFKKFMISNLAKDNEKLINQLKE